MKIGIIGTGNMGAAMWRNLKNRGHTATVYDVRREATQPLASQGAPVASSPKDLAGKVQVAVLSLPTSRHVDQVMFGKDGFTEGAKAGAVVLDTTSGDPMQSRRIAQRAGEMGVRYVDLGVSGGPQGAGAGTLRLMIGGDKKTADEVMPLLNQLGDPKITFYCGEAGAGHAMKTLLNLRNQTINMVTAECLLIGQKFGLDPNRVIDVTGAGAIWANYIINPAGRKAIGFSIGLASKDEDVAIGLAHELGVSTFVSTAGQQIFRAAMAELGPDADVFRFVDVLERWSRVNLPGSPNRK